MTRSARRSRYLLGALLGVAIPAPRAAAQLPPDAAYRELDTPHFTVVFPRELETIARRAAARAEWVHGRLAASIDPPDGRIHIVLADNLDFAQGLASVTPRNRVVLYVAPPIANAEIEFTDDWLAMALAHELAHVFHLDAADGVWAISRTILGRSLLGFPALFQPTWVKEGIATYFESRLTGGGRLEGSYHAMLLRSAARDGTLLPIHDANGLSPYWPVGRTPYVYGSRFLDEHARDASELGAFVREADGNVWGLGLDGDAKKAFGIGFKPGWRAWTDSLRREADADATAAVAEASGGGEAGLARGAGNTGTTVFAGPAYSIASPRFDRTGRRLAFELYDGRGDRVTRILELEETRGERGRGRGRVRVVEQRRNSPGGHAWSVAGDVLVYDQVERAGPFAIRRDLYALDPATGRERRLTREARLGMADPAPDGDGWIAVETLPGTSRLVRLRFTEAGEPELEPFTNAHLDTQWLQARWAPDGRTLAAARWTRGGYLDIVLLDDEGRVTRELTRDRAVDDAPTWSPDGRFVIWSSDRGGARALWALDVTSPADSPVTYRLARERGGAFDPDVAPDARRLAYVAFTGRGFVLRVVPYDPSTWTRTPLPGGPVDPVAEVYADSAAGATRPYRPWRTLLPTSWLPVWTESNSTQGAFVGPFVTGADVVGRHAYAAVASLSTRTADLEAALAYTYLGFGNPGLEIEVERDWSVPFSVGDSLASTEVLDREHMLRISARWEWPRFRHAESLEWGLEIHRRDLRPADRTFALPPGVRPTLTEYGSELRLDVTTARAYPFSISVERGWRATLRARAFRVAEAPRLWFASARGAVRAYVPIDLFGFASHVVALRAAGAGSIYDGRREIFSLGGVPGTFESPFSGVSLGDGADFPVRGFDEGALVGDRIAAGTIEYRFPIALLTQGLGLAPLYFDRVSGSLFLDAGAVWQVGTGTAGELASAGAELSLDLVLSHSIPYRLRAGVARTLSGPASVSGGWELHVAIGPAF